MILPLEAQGVQRGHQGVAERPSHPGEVKPAQVQRKLLDVGARVVSIAIINILKYAYLEKALVASGLRSLFLMKEKSFSTAAMLNE